MNLRKFIGGFILLFTMTACVSAQQESNSLLWKISGNGLQKPSYLFGTHHLVPVSFLDSISGVNAAFDDTEQTVGELDMADMAQMQAKIMSEALMPQTHSYAALLSEADLQLLDTTLKDVIGMGINQLGTMKPAMLSNLISIMLYQRYYPQLSGGKSIDEHFQQQAALRNRPVVALETADDQIYALLNSKSIERQAELLACMLNHPEMLKTQMDKLNTAYMNQDLEALNALYEEELPDDPCPSTQEEKDVLNKDRNEKWLAALPEIMRQKSSFIAVGCLHLVGENGLIEGLRKAGYTVETVK